MEEVWKDIKGCENKYQVSNLGNIKNVLTNTIIRGSVFNNGYKFVSIKGKNKTIHRLVAQAFIPNPNDYPVINHIDGNKLNNCVDNLEWCTYKYNTREAIKLGLMKIKYNSYDNRIRAKKVAQYTKDNIYIKTFIGSIDAEKELKQKGIKINARNIRNVCKGKRKTAGGYKWEYVN